jgi:hypothetical protein
MTHSYYFTMGGYAMDDSDSDQKFMPEDTPRITVAKSGLGWLIKNNLCLLPNLSESQVRDKSKASGLAKMLVCTQAIWFCVQCIVRLSQNLTICLLELNTFAHALCALLIYLLWWNKPLDVDEPSLLVGEYKDEFVASSLQMARDRITWMGLDKSRNKVPDALDQDVSYMARFVLGESHVEQNDRSSAPSNPVTLRKGESFHGWVYTGVQTIWLFSTQQYDDYFEEFCFNFDSRLLRRLELCAVATRLWNDPPNLHLHSRVRNWPSTMFDRILDIEFDREGFKLLTGFTAAGLIYGAMHLCAWNAFFSSKAQLDLWHISSLTLAVSGPAILLSLLARKGTPQFEAHPKRWKTFVVKWIIYGSIICFYVCFALLYIFARVYLVVECFLSLAHLPPSAFKIPVWSQYVPHIV